MDWLAGLFYRCCNRRVAPAPVAPEVIASDFLGLDAARDVREVKLILNENKEDKVVVSLTEQKHTVNIIQTDELHLFRKLEQTSPTTWNLYHNRNLPGVILYFSPLVDSRINRLDTVVFNDSGRPIDHDLCRYFAFGDAHTVSITKESVTEQELALIRWTFSRIRRLRVSSDLPEREMNFPLNYSDVKMCNGLRITKDVLRNMACDRLEIQQTNLKASELLDLIRLWSRGECWVHLQSLVIRRVDGDIPEDHIFRRYITYTWQQSQRGKYFVQDEKTVFDCGEEKDIKRVRDGRVATIIYHKNTFRFYVWEKLKPSMPRNGFAILNRDSSSFMEY